jgi:hypothetical protein
MSTSSHLPADFLDGDLLPGFLVIIIPFSLGQIYTSERCGGFSPLCFPFSLRIIVRNLA